jgi:ankyrin repeat protein
MKGVKGASFGVRFYRRAGAKIGARDMEQANIANSVEDVEGLERAMTMDRAPMSMKTETATHMTDIPPQSDRVVLAQEASASIKATNPYKKKSDVAAPRPSAKEQMLFMAAKTGDCAKIRMMVMDGVDLDARDSAGRTAINIATQYSQQNALKTLLAAREMRRMAKLGELPQTIFYKKFDKTA